MKGYTIKKHDSYPIKGSDGRIYLLPPFSRLSVEDATLLNDFNNAVNDIKKRLTICKKFILAYAPELKNDPEIGDYEYFLIFNDYNQEAAKDYNLGES